MGGIAQFARSSIGAKLVMALTGVVVVGYVVVHMLGNLQLYAGQDTYNGYAAMLKSSAALLWSVRVIFGGALIVHIVSAIRLSQLNRAARPQAYDTVKPRRATYASRTMMLTGSVLLAFVVFHLLHLTIGLTHPDHYALRDPMGRHDVYSMLVLGFQSVPVAISYVVAMVLLGFHLSHGVSSMFRSLGLDRAKYTPMFKRLGLVVAVALVLGNISMPISVLLGFIKLPAGVM